MTLDNKPVSITEPAKPAVPFPPQPEDVTPEWLTSVLRDQGVVAPGESVTGLSSDCLSAGIGMMGTVSRLHLTYSGPGHRPGSLIMKSASESTTNRDVANHFRLYEREVKFYRELGPALEPAVPHAFFADFAPETVDYSILMEDLAGYRTGDQVAGASIDEALLAVDALATFHATWWGRTDDPLADWVPSTNAPLIRDSMITGCRDGWDGMVAKFAEDIPDELLAQRDAYLAALPGLYDAMTDGNQTLAHTDYRVDNMMFGVEPHHQPIVVVDWSAVAKSKGVQDLAYFLTQNLSDDCRRDHQDELFARYHDALAREGVQGYSYDQFREDYDLAVLFNFVYAIVIASALDLDNDRATAFVGKLVGRSASSIVTRGLLDRLPELAQR